MATSPTLPIATWLLRVKRTVGLVVAALLCSAVATAQSVFVVDAAGGGDFTDIQSAVDAASPGDLVRVRHGSYTHPVQITKGIRLIGDPHIPQVTRVNIESTVEVVGIPSNQSLVAAELYRSVNSFEMLLQNCQGPVHLDKVAATPRILNCSYVTITQSSGIGDTFQNPGSPGLVVQDSYVAMTDCGWGTAFDHSAIHAVRSRLVMVRSTAQILNIRNSAMPSSPVVLEDSLLTRSIDTQFGVNCPFGAVCPPLVEKIGASVDAQTNNRSVLVDEVTSELILRAPPQTPVAVLVSLPGMPVEINQGLTLGTLYLDLPSSQFLFLGQTGFGFLRLPIPDRSAERVGIPLTFQAGIMVGQTLQLSHPTTVVY